MSPAQLFRIKEIFASHLRNQNCLEGSLDCEWRKGELSFHYSAIMQNGQKTQYAELPPALLKEFDNFKHELNGESAHLVLKYEKDANPKVVHEFERGDRYFQEREILH